MDAVEYVDVDSFRSPYRKLLRHFCSSRNQWKRKCMRAKSKSQLMSNQVRAVEKSRAMWRRRYETEQEKNEQLRRELGELKRAAAS